MHFCFSRLKIRLNIVFKSADEITLRPRHYFFRHDYDVQWTFPREAPFTSRTINDVSRKCYINTKCADIIIAIRSFFLRRRVSSIKVASNKQRVALQRNARAVRSRNLTRSHEYNLTRFPRPDVYRGESRKGLKQTRVTKTERPASQPADVPSRVARSSRSPSECFTLGNAAHPKALQRRFASRCRPTQRRDFSRCISAVRCGKEKKKKKMSTLNNLDDDGE